MQGLVRRLTVVTRHHYHHQPQPNLSFNPHRISHTRPSTHIAQPSNLGHHIPSSSSSTIHLFHSCRSQIRSSFSQSITVRNYLSTLFAKNLLHRTLPRVHFHRQNFNFNHNFNSYRRGDHGSTG
ncbi:hypothetical protein TSUD_208150 [Trifolium subterraneum]|uniref:Uncharacterized protein n=1 Tax=Trifolium subterraneum TaxID=3900 RepID=A0A2Z6NJD1_TRISU|nr:hypothetical protein TSUD_208150 [Trifolium subterraneum]